MQQWDLPLLINISLIGWEWKNYVENTCWRTEDEDFLTEDEVLMGKDTAQNISVRSLTLLCGGVNIVWSTTTRTRVNGATAVTFSVKCFNPLILYHLSGNIFRNWFASLFIYSRAFNQYWSPNSKSDWCNNTFIDARFTSLLAKNIEDKYKLFLCC